MTSRDPDTDAEVDDVAAAAGGGSGSPRQRAGRAGKRRQLPLWQETILLLGVAIVLAIVIKALFLQAFYIPSESMEPGLVRDDRILVQKVSYWGDAGPERGDVVVFEDPGSWLSAAQDASPANPVTAVLARIGLYPVGGHLVKRVVGVGGDTITCCDTQGRIAVNGEPLDEGAYVKEDPASPCNGPMLPACTWTAGPVPEGHVFVMGDNRNNSADSTVHMCREGATQCVPGREFVSTDLVVGKVFLVAWPLSNAGFVAHPDIFDDVPEAETSDASGTSGRGPEAGPPVR